MKFMKIAIIITSIIFYLMIAGATGRILTDSFDEDFLVYLSGLFWPAIGPFMLGIRICNSVKERIKENHERNGRYRED